MDAATRAVLNTSETLLVDETSRKALAELDEDAAIALEARIRRARDKYVSIYRRTATTAVEEHGGRGRARKENTQNARKAEAFERALSRVSRRVAVLAQESAAALRTERLAMARAAKQRDYPGSGGLVPRQGRREHVDPAGPDAPPAPAGEMALRNPATETARADTRAAGARRQGKRDSKRLTAR
jgi:hypothetical protein